MKPSYLYNEDPYTGKMVSLYWDGPQIPLLYGTGTWMVNHFNVLAMNIWLASSEITLVDAYVQLGWEGLNDTV